MESHEVLHILRHKRHDWMNQIQLVQGYASMGKMERVKEHLRQIVDQAEHERRLLNCKADNFSLWLFTFNWSYNQYQLTYLLDEDIDLSSHDKQLAAYAKKIVSTLDEHSINDELYEGILHIYKSNELISLNWSWVGEFNRKQELAEKLESFGVTDIDNPQEVKLNCTIE